jgi:hypothetical protein
VTANRRPLPTRLISRHRFELDLIGVHRRESTFTGAVKVQDGESRTRIAVPPGRSPAGPCGHRELARYQQGGICPFEQLTVDPGGTTIVVFFGGGGLSWKLRQPPRLSGMRTTRINLRMRWIPSGRHCIQVALVIRYWNDPLAQMTVRITETRGRVAFRRSGA